MGKTQKKNAAPKKVKAYVRRPRGCPWDSPRLLAVIDLFGSVPGGELQIEMEKLSEATGIPISSMKRHVDWAVEYGAITRQRQYAFGKGRLPNLYRSVVTLEQWLGTPEEPGVGQKMYEAWVARSKPVKVSRHTVAPRGSTPAPAARPSSVWAEVR